MDFTVKIEFGFVKISTLRDGGLPATITFLYNLDMYEPIFLQLPCYEYYAELDEYEENEENEEEE